MGYSFAASSTGAELSRLFWYSSSVSSCSCKFPLGFSVIPPPPPPLRSCALAANPACTFLLCPAWFQGHTQKAKHNLSTHPKLLQTQKFSYWTWPGMFCLLLLEAIWRTTQQKIVLFSSLHSTFHTPPDSSGIMVFVAGVLSWDTALGKN